MDKFKGVLEYLESVPDDEIVIFVDGFDTVIKKDLTNVERIFESMNCGVLISAQKDNVMKYATRKIFTSCQNSIVNSGLYMGYTKYLRYMLKEALQSGEDDDQRALNMICNKVSFIKIDTDCIIFENCFNSEKCVKNSNAYIVQTPGQLSVQRYFRAVKEYSSYFIPELVIIIIILYFLVQKTCTK
jgi:hypothetical protein